MTLHSSQVTLASAKPVETTPKANNGANTPKIDHVVESTPPVATKQQVANTPPLTEEQIQNAVTDISRAMETLTTRFNARLDDDTGKWVLQIVDTESNKVVKQIPPEEMLELSKRLKDLVGLLFDMEI